MFWPFPRLQVNVARDVAVQMCDTLEGKAYTGVVNVSYMAVANEVGECLANVGRRKFLRLESHD